MTLECSHTSYLEVASNKPWALPTSAFVGPPAWNPLHQHPSGDSPPPLPPPRLPTAPLWPCSHLTMRVCLSAMWTFVYYHITGKGLGRFLPILKKPFWVVCLGIEPRQPRQNSLSEDLGGGVLQKVRPSPSRAAEMLGTPPSRGGEGLPSIRHEPPAAGRDGGYSPCRPRACRCATSHRGQRGAPGSAYLCFQRGHPRGTSGSVSKSVPSSPPGAHGRQGHISIISMSLEATLKERVLRSSQSAPPLPAPPESPSLPWTNADIRLP